MKKILLISIIIAAISFAAKAQSNDIELPIIKIEEQITCDNNQTCDTAYVICTKFTNQMAYYVFYYNENTYNQGKPEVNRIAVPHPEYSTSSCTHVDTLFLNFKEYYSDLTGVTASKIVKQ